MEAKDTTKQSVPFADNGNQLGDRKNENKKSFWSEITLEPVWLGIFISSTFDIVIFKNLFIERACRIDLGYPENVCFVIGALNTTIEKESQSVVSSVSVLSGFLSGAITCTLVLFLGPWSDASGRRKPLMIMAIGADALSSLTTIAALYLPQLPVIWVIFMKNIPYSFGNVSIIVLSMYSYLGDICYKTKRNATIVMGRNGAFIHISIVIGSYLAPIIYKKSGFVGITIISFYLKLISLLYVYFKVKDFNISEKLPSLFDLSLPINGVKCLFKKRAGYKRQIVLFMLLIPVANVIIMTNDIQLRYLYLRNVFAWTQLEYGNLLSLRQCANAIGILIIVKIVKDRLKMRDELIGIIGAIAELSDIIIFMIIRTSWGLYATTIFALLSSAPILVERPIINKFIRQDEQGKIYSVITIMDMFFASSVMPLSNYVYSRTLSWFPSCFMMISAAGAVTQIVSYLFVIQLCKKEKAQRKKNCSTQNHRRN